ncbi:hypothetical protein I6F11_10550 [Ensifer sp. NBAIM29]|nr:hypothetical protein [Ensifer sp. NBAIM29]
MQDAGARAGILNVSIVRTTDLPFPALLLIRGSEFHEVFPESEMQQTQSNGGDRARAPEMPPSAQDHGSDERIGHHHPIGARSEDREAVGDHAVRYDDGAGGEAWNRTLGGNTNSGMARLLAIIALFIVVGASLFWLFAG